MKDEQFRTNYKTRIMAQFINELSNVNTGDQNALKPKVRADSWLILEGVGQKRKPKKTANFFRMVMLFVNYSVI